MEGNIYYHYGTGGGSMWNVYPNEGLQPSALELTSFPPHLASWYRDPGNKEGDQLTAPPSYLFHQHHSHNASGGPGYSREDLSPRLHHSFPHPVPLYETAQRSDHQQGPSLHSQQHHPSSPSQTLEGNPAHKTFPQDHHHQARPFSQAALKCPLQHSRHQKRSNIDQQTYLQSSHVSQPELSPQDGYEGESHNTPPPPPTPTNHWPFPAWAKLKPRPSRVGRVNEGRGRAGTGYHHHCQLSRETKGEGRGDNPTVTASVLARTSVSEASSDQSKGDQQAMSGSSKQRGSDPTLNAANDTALPSSPCSTNRLNTVGQVQSGGKLNQSDPHRDPIQLSLSTGNKGEKRKERCGCTKKRTKDEEKWKRNVRKKARSKGESYTSVQGKTVPARRVKAVDCSKCKFNCPARVSEDDRWNLFKQYWGFEAFKDKVNYICNSVHEFAPLRPVSGRKSFSRRYTLKVSGRVERVCKEFFISTFDISESTISTSMAKQRKGPEAVADLRGKGTPGNKTPGSVVRAVREHILYQTGLQGRLASGLQERHDTTPQSVKQLYSHYRAECQSDGTRPASISVYRRVHADMQSERSGAPLVELSPEDAWLSGSRKSLEQPVEGSEDAYVSSDGDDVVPLCLSSTSVSRSSTVAPLSGPCRGHATGPVSEDQVKGRAMEDLFTERSIINCSDEASTSHVRSPHPDRQLFHSQQWKMHHSGGTVFNNGIQGHSGFTLAGRSQSNSSPYGAWASNGVPDSNVDLGAPACPMQNSLAQPFPALPLPSHLSSLLSSSLLANDELTTSYGLSSNGTPSSAANRVLTKESSTSPAKGKNGAVQAGGSKHRKRPRDKRKQVPSKRSRNEESWGRNVRKRLRFKGEAYTSVRGKQVGAKLVQQVDCSRCKFRCTTKMSEDQRSGLNKHYWSLDTYKEKVDFLNRHVETCTPKRKMTGRRAFSRKYVFNVGGFYLRVCKDFFKATLHISESTIATALEKSRQGPAAAVDMRGRHKPGNKTPEETLQDIRELVIYLTGLRPNRPATDAVLGPRFRDVNHLYKIYSYDCERKGRTAASVGIFRGVLTKDFRISREALQKKRVGNENKILENIEEQINGEGRQPAAALTHLSTREAVKPLPVTMAQLVSVTAPISVPVLDQLLPSDLVHGVT